MVNEKSLILVDFDGTVADSYSLIIDCLEKYLNITIDDPCSLKNLSSKDVVRKLGIRWYQIPTIIRLVRRKFKDEISTVSEVRGVLESLTVLKEKTKAKVFLVSSNSKENIHLFLAGKDNSEVFDGVVSMKTVFGKAKKIGRFIEKSGFSRENTWYIADETRDIADSKRNGLKSAAVTWGYNSKEALIKYNPTIFVENPSELHEKI